MNTIREIAKFLELGQESLVSVAESLKAEARLEVARKMIQKGIELIIVWRVTGLTEEELRSNGIIR